MREVTLSKILRTSQPSAASHSTQPPSKRRVSLSGNASAPLPPERTRRPRSDASDGSDSSDKIVTPGPSDTSQHKNTHHNPKNNAIISFHPSNLVIVRKNHHSGVKRITRGQRDVSARRRFPSEMDELLGSVDIFGWSHYKF